MSYNGIKLKKNIKIGKIFSIHYFEYMSDFSFEGESHGFWEFICVDKGEVAITAGESVFILKKGNIAFHEPNEFHNVKANGKISPCLVVVSFDCPNNAMDFFRRQILKIDETERNLLANIIIEARHCFNCRLDDPYLQNMPLKNKIEFGSQQLILLYLEQFLIHIIRRYTNMAILQKKLHRSELPKITKTKSDSETFNLINEYLHNNISKNITIDTICQTNLISRSKLQKIFKAHCSMGVIEYFSHLKVDLAKEMIRTNKMNFTQISERLGYSSIHYFSRQFKKIAHMTPTDYASSIKAMMEGSFKTTDK